MTTFTLTGTFTHQNGITPISKSPIHVHADPFPLGSTVQTDRIDKVTDANGTVTFTLTTGVTGLYYVVRSTAKRPLFKPIRFLAPAAGTVLNINTLIFYNPGDPPLEQSLIAIRDLTQGYASQAQGAVSLIAWAPATVYTAGAVRQAPDGTAISRLTSGTSTSTFTADAANWTPVAIKAGTLEQIALSATNAPRRSFAPGTVGGVGPFTPAKQFTTSGSTQAVGYDQTDNLLILCGQNSVQTSSDNGATLSADKGVPLLGQTNPGNQVGAIVRFKALWVCLIKDQTLGCAAIYTSPAPGAAGSCTWTLRKNFTTGSDGRFGTDLAQDGTQVIAGEYGDPLTAGTKNPHIWRSTDGLTWTATWSASGGTNRHVHAVYPDSTTSNVWWASFGDGPSPCLLKSTDGGVNWTGVAAIDSSRQVVQISDDATNLYLAADATVVGTPGSVWVLDKATNVVIGMGQTRDHRRISVPSPGSYATGSITSGTAVFTDFTNANFGSHLKGARIVVGTAVPAGTTVLSVDSTVQLTLSANATATVSSVGYQFHGISEQWFSDPFAGVIDPATGVYYFTTPGDSTGLPNVRRGLFYIPYIGGPAEFLDYVNASPRRIFIANGYLFCGNLRRPVLTPN